MPGLAERGELLGTAAKGAFIDIGVAEDYRAAAGFFAALAKR